MTEARTDAFPIPGRLNVALFVAAFPATWALLALASRAPLGWALLAAWAFAFVHHLPFSLLHEAVHGVFARSGRANELAGVLSAAAFPTSFTMQRVAHLGHHLRNRTDLDLYDYHLPHQSRLLRNVWLYAGNLLGLYWLLVPLGNLVYLVAPWLFTSRAFVNGPARVLGFGPYVAEVARAPKLRIWLECLLALAYQVSLFLVLGVGARGWLLCHGAFALHWSALQYVDHAFSPRDVVNGAWDLRVLPWTRALALNYHYHLAHHRHPSVPWIHLPRLVDETRPRPTFWSIYFRLWGGTRPAPPMEGASGSVSGS